LRTFYRKALTGPDPAAYLTAPFARTNVLSPLRKTPIVYAPLRNPTLRVGVNTGSPQPNAALGSHI